MSDLKNKLMDKVKEDRIKMRSRSFFVFTKAFVEVLILALIIVVLYLINLSIYLPKRGLGPVARSDFRLNLLLDIVPWHYLFVGALGLGIAFWLLYRFTGTYKKHFVITVSVISLVILLGSTLLAFSNFNERIQERPRLRGIYRMDQPGPGHRDGSGQKLNYLK